MTNVVHHFARGLGAAGNEGDVTGYMLARSYRYWRMPREMRARSGKRETIVLGAVEALHKAKSDVAVGKSRYPESIVGAASYGNLPDDRAGRRIEDPAAAGLRFVGRADELSMRGINHAGWYLDPVPLDGDVARGAVYQLPARNGRPLYVEAVCVGSDGKQGWRDMGPAGAALVFLGELHFGQRGGYQFDADNDPEARKAACGADEEARIYAEHEREYREAWSAGNLAADLKDEAAECRAYVHRLIAELRGLGSTLPSGICASLRESIRIRFHAAKRAAAESRKLREQWEGGRVDQRLQVAFADGAAR